MAKTQPWPVWAGMICTAALLLSSCRGQPAPPPLPAPTALPTAVPTPEPTPISTLAPTEPAQAPVQYLVDVEDAIIQIEAQGKYFSPKFSKVTSDPGRGSGFIIDPSGLALTTNHAVTGAESLQVWVGGNRSQPYTAEVLAASECFDLALIDLEGEGFTYLGWVDEPPAVGQKVYAAGYPLGGKQFLINGGEVAAPSADQSAGEALLPLITYDSETDPGMSGGPVLSPEGKIAGFHYAADPDTGAAFGLEIAALQTALARLAAGQSLEWIGINGQPVVSDDGTLMGMWVFAVEPGSLAETTGVTPGDLITFIGDQLLTGDTVFDQYCQALRSWDASGAATPLDLQVYRQNGDVLLEGELNGQPLKVVTTAALGILPTPAEGTPSAANLNAKQPGEVYLVEKFGAALSNWARMILQGDETKVTAELPNNDLLLTIDSVYTYVYYLFKPLKTTDVRLDISVENLGRNNNNVSLICRYSVERGWYEFNIANNGLWWVKRYDPRLNNFIDIGKGASKLINLGQAANDYSAVCKDNKLTLYINGKEAATLTDNNLATGQIGFSVSSFNVTPVTVKIDQFKASVP